MDYKTIFTNIYTQAGILPFVTGIGGLFWGFGANAACRQNCELFSKGFSCYAGCPNPWLYGVVGLSIGCLIAFVRYLLMKRGQNQFS